jgi:hypothetical protein
MTRLLLLGAAAFTMLSGYARAEGPATTAQAHDPVGEATADCPMSVTGAKLVVAHTAESEALTFSTTTPEKVAELRRRVHVAAEMHNKNHAGGGTHEDMMGDEMMGGVTGSNHMMGGTTGSNHMMDGAMGSNQMMGGTTGSNHMTGEMMMPQSHAAVADVDRGARITLTPSASTDLKQLQSAVHVRAERMQKHGCGMQAQK